MRQGRDVEISHSPPRRQYPITDQQQHCSGNGDEQAAEFVDNLYAEAQSNVFDSDADNYTS